jgi:hypothetical protein
MKLPIELEFKSTVILAGAGISIASGITSGQMFNSILLPRLIPAEIADKDRDRRSNPLLNPAPAHRRPARGNIRFEQLIQIIRRFADPDLLLMQYLELSWEPTTLHHWLAKAIAKGSIVLTTNLDSLIELAYLQEKSHCPRQIIDAQDWNTYDKNAPSILKLHGTIRRQSFLAQFNWHNIPAPLANRKDRAIETFGVTLDRIGNLVSSRDSTATQFFLPDYILSTLQQVLANRDLVIIGYSGSDDFDVMPSLWHLGEFYRRLIWIKHEKAGAPVIRSQRKLTIIRGSTLEIIESLFGEPLSISTSNINAKNALESFCDRWCQEIYLNEQKRFLITGSVLHAMGMLSNSISVWVAGLDNVKSNDPATAARFCLLLGEAYLAERSWYYANEVFEVAMLRSQRTSDIVLNTQSQLGYAFILAITSQVFENQPLIWKHACTLFGQLFGISAIEPELSEYEVRTALAMGVTRRPLITAIGLSVTVHPLLQILTENR